MNDIKFAETEQIDNGLGSEVWRNTFRGQGRYAIHFCARRGGCLYAGYIYIRNVDGAEVQFSSCSGPDTSEYMERYLSSRGDALGVPAVELDD